MDGVGQKTLMFFLLSFPEANSGSPATIGVSGDDIPGLLSIFCWTNRNRWRNRNIVSINVNSYNILL